MKNTFLGTALMLDSTQTEPTTIIASYSQSNTIQKYQNFHFLAKIADQFTAIVKVHRISTNKENSSKIWIIDERAQPCYLSCSNKIRCIFQFENYNLLFYTCIYNCHMYFAIVLTFLLSHQLFITTDIQKQGKLHLNKSSLIYVS